MWKKEDTSKPSPFGESAPEPKPASFGSGPPAVIGSSLVIDGTIRGEEDLLIEGRVKVDISLPNNVVTVGTSGIVEARIHAAVVVVEGTVRGDLVGEEQIEIRRSGNAQGNIIAPRVGLEDGAQFKGNIDMSKKQAEKPAASTSAPANSPANSSASGPAKQAASTPGSGGPEKVKNEQPAGKDTHTNLSK